MAKKNESKDPTVDTAVYAFVVTLFVAIGAGVWCNSLGLAVFIVIGGIYWVYTILTQGATPKRSTPVFRADGEGGRTLQETEYFCKIAGASHHDNKEGAFMGVVMSDPDNEYDKNAIAIYHNDGRLVGYIPRNEQKDFREWSTREPLPCVGFFCEGDYTDLYGKVKVIDADQRLTEIHIAKFVRWMVEKYGVKYIPNDFVIDSPDAPRTKAQWLDYLDEYIAQR